MWDTSVLYNFMMLTPRIVSPLILIFVGGIVLRKGQSESNSIVWAIGAIAIALGAANALTELITFAAFMRP